MDVLSVLGVIVGLVAILGGNWLEGGHLGALVNLPALVIVVGGTIGAATLQVPMSTLRLPSILTSLIRKAELWK